MEVDEFVNWTVACPNVSMFSEVNIWDSEISLSSEHVSICSQGIMQLNQFVLYRPYSITSLRVPDYSKPRGCRRLSGALLGWLFFISSTTEGMHSTAAHSSESVSKGLCRASGNSNSMRKALIIVIQPWTTGQAPLTTFFSPGLHVPIEIWNMHGEQKVNMYIRE